LNQFLKEATGKKTTAQWWFQKPTVMDKISLLENLKKIKELKNKERRKHQQLNL
jgi:hypothetical protein